MEKAGRRPLEKFLEETNKTVCYEYFNALQQVTLSAK
jgi:hypothetical protein